MPCLSEEWGMHKGGDMGLTVGVGTDEDPDTAAGGEAVRRQRVDVAADGRPAHRRLPRAGLPAPHSRRPHGGRLPAWLHAKQPHTEREREGTEGGMLVRPGRTRRHMDSMLARRFIHTHGALNVAKECFIFNFKQI